MKKMSLSTDLSASLSAEALAKEEVPTSRRVGTAAEGGPASGGSCQRQIRLGGKLFCMTALGIGLSLFAPAPAVGATLSTNAAWTWMKGANSTNQNGTYGTQGAADPANTPGARNGAVSWTDGEGALWLFGGGGYPASGLFGVLNDLWKFDPATTNWTWMKGTTTTNQNGTYGTQGVPAAGNTPGARYLPASWTDGTGALWLFGGYGYGASGGWVTSTICGNTIRPQQTGPG